MKTVCGFSANGAGDVHEIADGARRVDVAVRVDWGADDARATHEKPLSFCSFNCLSEWAAAKAAEHDDRLVVEGA